MKVRYAAQLFSSSVAKALRMLKNNNEPGFADAKPTAQFLEMTDKLFDTLNGMSSYAKGYKRAVISFLQKAMSYILLLRDSAGVPLIRNNRIVVLRGFLITIRSSIVLLTHLLKSDYYGVKLKFVCMYKFSQDHVELFFSVIRSRGGN